MKHTIITCLLTVSDVRSDQSTSASWWTQELAPSNSFTDTDTSNFFSSSHGLVQTHPAGFGGVNSLGQADVNELRPYVPASSLDFDRRGLDELRRNPLLSSPEECARACREGEPPKICYYHFTVELYTVLGA